MTTLRLEGKVAIVTGAASGIGEAAARLFAANGATVVVADIQDRLGHEVVASIGPDKSIYVHCDVTDEEQVKAAVDHAVGLRPPRHHVQQRGRTGLPFRGHPRPRQAGDGQGHGRQRDGDRGGHQARGAGDGGARRARLDRLHRERGGPPGGARAGGVRGLEARGAGAGEGRGGELGQHGIRVNCVSPYGVATPMSSAASGLASEVEGMFCAVANLKGVALRAGHVAEAALFLASEEAAYVSGHDLVVTVVTLRSTRLLHS
ncbi:putative short-chain dehydrogenase reductase 5 [Iris pallida]|uniref:Short-chain dehydrogenase reductase 5 n=1 Tax=Iris pallida TaxID=29817 RepID=A0AAX6IG79_IRIPA|nr:putative short-chain dehydrogenase reductase 5 [Iris pallida]